MSFPDIPHLRPIGRGIKKRLDNILHPPAQGPTKEERLTARLKASLQGLIYYDTFDEIFEWTQEGVEGLGVANTPLMKRPLQKLPTSQPNVADEDGDSTNEATHDLEEDKSSLILCHDYKGGFLPYEGFRPGDSQEPEYSCEYLQHVAIFIYFSHKLVNVPPASWINTCHRNGVQCLGTFIVENEMEGVERMFEQDTVNDDFVLARQLALMADAYGFDGWLLNIETTFPSTVKAMTSKMVGFIRCLKRHLKPDSQVIWYDALTIDNEIDYQNGLTKKNLPFAKEADVLFTNYRWDMRNVERSLELAERERIAREKICFGVDVWAQNTNMPGPPRVTFPRKGGGGTGCGMVSFCLCFL